jgi:hypothetical protein
VLGRAGEALPPLRRVADADPTPSNLMALAMALEATGDAAGAEEARRRAAAANR